MWKRYGCWRETSGAALVVVTACLAAGAAVGAGLTAALLGAISLPFGGDDERDAALHSCQRPYSDRSPWNTPIGPRPAYDPRSAEMVARIDGPLTSDPTQYTYPVYEVSRSTPRQTVDVSGRFSYVDSGGRRLTIRDGEPVEMPIPPGASAAEGSDAQIVLVDWRTGDEWGAWRLDSEDGRWKMTNGYHYNVRWSGVPPRSASGDAFGSRGAGVPYFAGLVRRCEIRRGRIDHALAFAFDAPSSEYVYPATKSDGNGIPGIDMPEGSRLQLDPSLTREQIESWGCRGPCLMIARALQRYGMYAIDNSGRAKVMLEYEDTARWRGSVDDETVSPIPISAFKVLRDAG